MLITVLTVAVFTALAPVVINFVALWISFREGEQLRISDSTQTIWVFGLMKLAMIAMTICMALLLYLSIPRFRNRIIAFGLVWASVIIILQLFVPPDMTGSLNRGVTERLKTSASPHEVELLAVWAFSEVYKKGWTPSDQFEYCELASHKGMKHLQALGVENTKAHLVNGGLGLTVFYLDLSISRDSQMPTLAVMLNTSDPAKPKPVHHPAWGARPVFALSKHVFLLL